jgi:hypothetical protein
MKFTFDVSKCDCIFDELLRLGHLKITHVIPPLEELKRRAYCKFHNSPSHATNDCNVFRRHVQSAINEGRLTSLEMKIDKALFPVHTIDLNNAKVLIRPDQAEGVKGKNVIIGDERPLTVDNKILATKVVQEKAPDGEKNLRIILKPRTLEGQEGSSSGDQSVAQPRPVAPTSQTSLGGRSDRLGGQPRTFKPKRLEVGIWKTKLPKVQGKLTNQKPNFGQLLNKSSKAIRNDRPLKKRPHYYNSGFCETLKKGL